MTIEQVYGLDYGIVKHYKNRQFYVLLPKTLNPDTKRWTINYKALYGTGTEYNRDSKIFYQLLPNDQGEMVRRFELWFINNQGELVPDTEFNLEEVLQKHGISG